MSTELEYNNETNRQSEIKHRVTPLDGFIGDRLKQIRVMLGLTQSALATMLGITFQQVQKYEQGINRISAATLWHLSEKLGIDVPTFFPGGENGIKFIAKDSASNDGMNSMNQLQPCKNDEIVELISAYYAIKDPKLRDAVRSLMLSMSHNNSAIPIQKKD